MPRTSLRGWSLAGLLAAAAASADPLDSPLTEAEVRRMLPVLRAEAADLSHLSGQLEALLADSEQQAQRRQRLVEDIGARKVDPLQWLSRHSRHAVKPEGTRYDAACSRVWTRHVGRPAVLFALPAGSGVARTRAFYESRGFEEQGLVEPYNWSFEAPDASLAVSVMELNHFARHPDCAGLGQGPAVVMAVNPEWGPEKPAGVPVPVVEGKHLERALQAAGMSAEDYQRARLRLVLAREVAEDPALLDAGQEEVELAGGAGRALRKKREERQALRRASAEVYRKHARELGPLLEPGPEAGKP